MAFSTGSVTQQPKLTDCRKRDSRRLRLETCEPRQLLAADLAVDITDGGAPVETGAEGESVLALKYADALPAAAKKYQVHGSIVAEAGVASKPRNNRDSSTTPVRNDKHDLSLKITDQGASVQTGGVVTYVATYQNRGEATAVAPVITVNLPEFTTFDAESSSDGWECVEGVCTLTVGDLAPGDTGAAVLGLSVGEDLPADQSRIRIWASIQATEGADAKLRNNRNISVTPIEEATEDEPVVEGAGEPAARALGFI